VHLIRKLSSFLELSERDETVLRGFCTKRIRQVARGESIVEQGGDVQYWHVFCDGWAMREKVLEDGRTQAVGLLVPGDICGLDPIHMKRADHTIRALTSGAIGLVTGSEIRDAMEQSQRISAVFAISGLEAQSVQREWTLNVGRRDAEEGLAHLISELHHRLSRAGVTEDDSFTLPMTQQTIGDCLALSSVHLSRSLTVLRKEGMVSVAEGRITIRDLARLHARAGFDPAYLEIAR
jgi:CRP-like cAMP-binding protein